MSCWLSYKDSFFDSLAVSTDTEKQRLATLIQSAVEFVERFCNRKFAEDTYTKVLTVQQDGSLILENPPISHVVRCCFDSYEWIKLQNTTATVANFSTTDTGLHLQSITGGVTTNSSLLWSAYPTLTTLASAIAAVSGWSATVTTGKGSVNTTDIKAQQFGNATTANWLSAWSDYAGTFDFDSNTGIIEGAFGRGLKARLTWVGGFDPVPQAVKLATSNLVKQGFESTGGTAIKSISLGEFSYTTEDVSKLPLSDQKILSQFRDRRV